MPETIHLICFPRGDTGFQALAVATLRGMQRDGRTDGQLAEAVREIIAAVYPACVIRSRDPLAELWPDHSTWYVYRDGSALAGRGPTAQERAAGPGQTINELE